MATDVHQEPGTAALVGGIINDVQELLKQQMTLFKVELQQDMDKAKKAVQSAFLGLGIMLAGTVVLALTLAYLLFWAFPTVPLWVCHLIAGVVVTGLGLALACLALRESEEMTVHESVKSLEENVEWKTNRK
jgi:uncharacterized membrane protein YqjE